MIALDTNIIVRLLVQDEQVQLRRIKKILDKECSQDNPGLLNCIVLVETVWVLESAYKYERKDIAHAIEMLFRIKEFEIQYLNEAWEALNYYRNGNIDFSDAYLASINCKLGCSRTLTLDKKAARMDLFQAV